MTFQRPTRPAERPNANDSTAAPPDARAARIDDRALSDRATPGQRRFAGGAEPRTFVGPVLAALALALVAWLTFALLTGDVRLPGPSTGGGAGGIPTPAPSNVVIIDPRVDVPGSIVYVKAGNVWIQSGKNVRQVTSTGNASMASWAPDGKTIFYVETSSQRGLSPINGGTTYVMTVPTIMRVSADGSGQPQAVYSSLVRQGRYSWSFWIRDPVLSPDDRTLAMATDGRNPITSDVVIQMLDLQTGRLNKPRLPENSPLGHQDPAWSSDGRTLLYVRNARDAARGTPSIYRYDVTTGRNRALTGPGYLSPSWSRDGRYVAATRTDSFGTNVVILDAASGTELLKVTTDGNSWSPVWSPKGNAIAFLHVDGQIIDLQMISLSGNGPNWKLDKPINLTEVSALDGASHPGWFIPSSQLPSPTPAASVGASGSAPPSPSAP
jgi:dipeptidyl aminopeptidase/acylaminoacyl peptidase